MEAILLWCFPLVKVEFLAEVDLEEEGGVRMTVIYSTWQLSEVISESNDADTPNEPERFSAAPSLVLSTKRLVLILSHRLLNWSLIHCLRVLGLPALKMMTQLDPKRLTKRNNTDVNQAIHMVQHNCRAQGIIYAIKRMTKWHRT